MKVHDLQMDHRQQAEPDGLDFHPASGALFGQAHDQRTETVDRNQEGDEQQSQGHDQQHRPADQRPPQAACGDPHHATDGRHAAWVRAAAGDFALKPIPKLRFIRLRATSHKFWDRF